MAWIKCEDRLPESLEPVLVTGVMMNGKKTVWADVRYNAEEGGWEYLNETFGTWEILENEVTHWMYCPKPAED